MLNIRDLQELPVVSLPIEEQKIIVEEYETKVSFIKNAMLKLDQEAQKAQLDLFEKMGINKNFFNEERKFNS